VASDLSSPQAALRSLVAAYIGRDLEAAVAVKDFRFEAQEMLLKLAQESGVDHTPDEQMIAEVADILELQFRNHMIESGFPDFSAYRCEVVREVPVRQNLVQLTEVCTATADGSVTVQELHAVKRGDSWRIVDLAF
jgi:hypothetical protein